MIALSLYQNLSMKFEFKNILEERTVLNTLAALILTIIISSLTADIKFTRGVLVGGILALINYYWLDASWRNILEIASSSATGPAIPIGRYILRYLTIGIIVYLISFYDVASILGILIGLCMIAAGILIEAFFLLIKTLTTKEEGI
mgnify:CR=1 FL=1